MLVIDLSYGVAGPYCTRLLAGLGAEVIKIEPPDEGDPARRWLPLLPDANPIECGALFQHLNGCKQSVTLRLESPGDRRLLEELLSEAQVVVESFAPGALASMELGYPQLAATNPGLVMTSVSGFGQTGPYRDYLATDLTSLAMGGLLYTCGDPSREPLKPGGLQAEYLAGLNAAAATLAALLGAEATGEGRWVDVSAMESVVSALEATTVAFSRDGTVRKRQGNRHGRTHPMAISTCKDGHVGVMLAADTDWELFSQLAGEERLLRPEFARGEDRLRLADEIDIILRPFLTERTREELLRWAQEVRLPFSMVLMPQELLNDPQHQARGFLTTVEHLVAGDVLQVEGPFQMAETPWRIGRAPLLGEHTERVLRERRAHGSEVRRAQCGLESAGFGEADPSPRPPSRRGKGETLRRRLPSPCRGGAGGGVDPDAGRGRRGPPLPTSYTTPLEGVRVVDLTTMWAGPLCTRLLADLGAEVIKVEAPARPDGTRGNPGYFSWLNSGKLGVTMNLNVAGAKDGFKRLVAESQVVVENFSPRVMRNFGLDYPALREVNPDVIMLSMPAYGSDGPYANHVAYGPGLEASSGLATLTRYREGPPMLSGSAYADPVAGLHGAVAVLAALRHLRHTGIGQWVDLAQREALSQMFGEVFPMAARGLAGWEPGNRHPEMAPHGCYRCRGDDRWIAIAVGSDAEWRRLCRVIGRDALADDPRYAGLRARKANEDRLDHELESWTRKKDPHEAMRLLQEARLAAGVVMDARDLVVDPHLAARGFFRRMTDVEGQPCDFPGLPWRMATSKGEHSRAPRLGEHNREILGGLLGLSDVQIGELQG